MHAQGTVFPREHYRKHMVRDSKAITDHVHFNEIRVEYYIARDSKGVST